MHPFGEELSKERTCLAAATHAAETLGLRVKTRARV